MLDAERCEETYMGTENDLFEGEGIECILGSSGLGLWVFRLFYLEYFERCMVGGLLTYLGVLSSMRPSQA